MKEDLDYVASMKQSKAWATGLNHDVGYWHPVAESFDSSCSPHSDLVICSGVSWEASGNDGWPT